jgi:hypothetical protein
LYRRTVAFWMQFFSNKLFIMIIIM